MIIWVRHRNWRSTDNKRYNECDPDFDHHDEFPLFAFAQLRRYSINKQPHEGRG
jgi:hypothetical protein